MFAICPSWRAWWSAVLALALLLPSVPTSACCCQAAQRPACCQSTVEPASAKCCRQVPRLCAAQGKCGCEVRRAPQTIEPPRWYHANWAALVADHVAPLEPVAIITANTLARRDTGPPRDWVIELHCFRT